MTFNVIVPNAGQSPGVFPAQNNTNFDRLKDIINQEHNFLDTEPVPPESQGIHKQCTFINRTNPVTFPGGNGVLYSQFDANNESQLRWYNGTVAAGEQITGGSNLLATGTITVATNSVATMYTIPNADGIGYIYMWVDGSPTKMSVALWTSIAGGGINVFLTGKLYAPPVSAGATLSYPIFYSVGLGSFDLKPFTSGAGFNDTYNYRVYRLG